MGTAVATLEDEAGSDDEVAGGMFALGAMEVAGPARYLARARVEMVPGAEDSWMVMVGFGSILLVGTVLAATPIILGGYLAFRAVVHYMYGR